jgi:phosphoribosylpyrophosphate synthetase
MRFEITSLAPVIAAAIRHIHRDESLSDMQYPA